MNSEVQGLGEELADVVLSPKQNKLTQTKENPRRVPGKLDILVGAQGLPKL